MEVNTKRINKSNMGNKQIEGWEENKIRIMKTNAKRE